jgi:hypothetical protein
MRRVTIARSRAQIVFSARIKAIRAENTVMDKKQAQRGGLSEIADCARMWFSSVRNR